MNEMESAYANISTMEDKNFVIKKLKLCFGEEKWLFLCVEEACIFTCVHCCVGAIGFEKINLLIA